MLAGIFRPISVSPKANHMMMAAAMFLRTGRKSFNGANRVGLQLRWSSTVEDKRNGKQSLLYF